MSSSEKYGELWYEDSNKFILKKIRSTIILIILFNIGLLLMYFFILFTYNNRIDNRVIDVPIMTVCISFLFGGLIILSLFNIKKTLNIKLQIYSNSIKIVNNKKQYIYSEFIPYKNIIHLKKKKCNSNYENIVIEYRSIRGTENYIIGADGDINTENIDKIYSLLTKKNIITEND